MKIDRFVKVMLVLIAMLLALNCAKNLSPSSEAAAPSFLQVGKKYVGSGGGGYTTFTIVEIQNTGWIKAKGDVGQEIWVNPSALSFIQ